MPIHGGPNMTLPLVLLPLIVVLDLGVVAYFIVDLYKPERRVLGGNKTTWLVIILLIGMLVLASTWVSIILRGAPTTSPLFTALLPLAVLLIYLPLMFYFIADLYKPERRVYGGDKTTWLVIILFGSFLGILAYLYFGRQS